MNGTSAPAHVRTERWRTCDRRPALHEGQCLVDRVRSSELSAIACPGSTIDGPMLAAQPERPSARPVRAGRDRPPSGLRGAAGIPARPAAGADFPPLERVSGHRVTDNPVMGARKVGPGARHLLENAAPALGVAIDRDMLTSRGYPPTLPSEFCGRAPRVALDRPRYAGDRGDDPVSDRVGTETVVSIGGESVRPRHAGGSRFGHFHNAVGRCPGLHGPRMTTSRRLHPRGFCGCDLAFVQCDPCPGDDHRRRSLAVG